MYQPYVHQMYYGHGGILSKGPGSPAMLWLGTVSLTGMTGPLCIQPSSSNHPPKALEVNKPVLAELVRSNKGLTQRGVVLKLPRV